MKKIFLSSVFILCFLSQFGQSVTLTFTAADSSAYVQLDSVMILNRTQGGETAIYWPDTTASLEITPGDLLLFIGYSSFYPVGVREAIQEKESFQLFQNYPNPVKDQSVISMYIPEKGMVNVLVTDLQGRVILDSDWQLDQGNHSFRFIPGDGHLFFLTARWNGISRSIKILTTEQHKGQRCMLHYEASTIGEPDLKAFQQTGNFILQKSAILDAPETDKTYIFQFASNIPCPGKTSVSYEGKVYSTLQILSQCWLKENLNVGSMIEGTTEQSNNGTIEKYCYDDDEFNCDTYGGLYQWNETMMYSTGQFAKGICPPGWHLPMDEEWKVLEGAIDGQYGFADPEWDGEGYRGFNVGSGLKEAGTTHWNPPNYGATNSSGITGLPGGNRDFSTGDFANMGAGGSFWSSSEDVSTSVWYRALNYASPHAYRKYIDKAAGYSVRCLRGCVPVRAYAGEDGITCEGLAFALMGATAANYASLSWTTSGTGTFDDPTLVNPTYTPSQEDLLMAEVMLTLSASGGEECPDATSTMTLMINGAPTANAGDDADICSTENAYTLSGNAIGYSSVLWTSSGSGTFNDPSSLIAIYTPSPEDKITGLITFTLTVNGNAPCNPVSDIMELRIWTGIANAGPDQLDVPGTYTTLAGNTPTFGNGLWQIVSGTGGTINDPDNPTSGFHGSIAQVYSLTWTISNIVCETSVDTVMIGFEAPWACGDNLVYEGQSYATVPIGDQCWFKENLNVGTMIPGIQISTNNGIIEKYCYNNDEDNCDIYGGFYQWEEAMQYVTTEGAQGICPVDWHIPTDNEWKILEGTVDSQYGVGDPEWDKQGEWRGFDAGGNLKEEGTAHWDSPNVGATNSSGFTALGAGYRQWTGNFYDIGFSCGWGSSTRKGSQNSAWGRALWASTAQVWRNDTWYDTEGGDAGSLRCLKND